MVRQGYGLVQVCGSAGAFDAFLLSLGELFDVAVQGVLRAAGRQFGRRPREQARRLTNTMAILGAMAERGLETVGDGGTGGRVSKNGGQWARKAGCPPVLYAADVFRHPPPIRAPARCLTEP